MEIQDFEADFLEIQDFEADFLCLKILNSGIILQTFTHVKGDSNLNNNCALSERAL